jgi:hypothetical protein
MGEKEIKPADPKPTDSIPGYPDELRTRERPGTGSKPPPNQPPTPPRQSGGGGSGASSGGRASGHVTFDDGYKMGRDPDGTTFLQHPDGGRATWNADNETWTRDDNGRRASNDWTQGHRPTDFGPKR